MTAHRGAVAVAAVLVVAGVAAVAGVGGRGRRAVPSTAAPVPTTVATVAASATTAPTRPWSDLGWVAAENRRLGTSAWHLAHLGAVHAIEGWADRASAAPGDPVRLYVSTTATRFRIAAYRMGWYGGLGGRLVWRSPSLPGRRQPPPVRTSGTNMVATRWRPSLRLTVGAD